MNREISSNSKKFLGLLIAICVVFFILVAKAFQYLPDSSEKNIVKHAQIDEINKPAASEAHQEENVEEEKTAEEKTLDIQLPYPTSEEVNNSADLDTPPVAAASPQPVATEPMESIDNQELTPEEQVEKVFATAYKLRNEKQFVKALEEYRKIPELTSDSNLVARSYEETATIYAIVKRYGTALSYAQKAYNMSPSSSREMLLARIYYKTGEIDKATTRINNVLKRDFAADR